MNQTILIMSTHQLNIIHDNIQTLIKQLKQENHNRSEFVKNNNHRLQYTEVKRQYCSILATQSRFELLIQIIEAQQKIIKSIQDIKQIQ